MCFATDFSWNTIRLKSRSLTLLFNKGLKFEVESSALTLTQEHSRFDSPAESFLTKQQHLDWARI